MIYKRNSIAINIDSYILRSIIFFMQNSIGCKFFKSCKRVIVYNFMLNFASFPFVGVSFRSNSFASNSSTSSAECTLPAFIET